MHYETKEVALDRVRGMHGQKIRATMSE